MEAVDGATGNVVPGFNNHVDNGIAGGALLISTMVGTDVDSLYRPCTTCGISSRQACNSAGATMHTEERSRCCKVIVVGKWLDEAWLRVGFELASVSCRPPAWVMT